METYFGSIHLTICTFEESSLDGNILGFKSSHSLCFLYFVALCFRCFVAVRPKQAGEQVTHFGSSHLHLNLHLLCSQVQAKQNKER